MNWVMTLENNILIVSPSETFSALAKIVLKKLQLDFKIIQTTDLDYLDKIADMVAGNQIAAMITRGYNLQVLREKFPIPIVDVRYTFEDIYYSYEEAVKISDKIAFISPGIAWDKADLFAKLSHQKLLIPHIDGIDEVESKVKELAEQGIEVFIGGVATLRAIEKLNVPAHSIDIVITESSLEKAFTDAVYLVQLEQERTKNQSFIESILEANDTGMIAVNPDGQVLYTNKKVVNFFSAHYQEFIENQLKKLVKEAIDSNSDLINQVVTVDRENFIINVSAIKSGNQVTGYLLVIERLDDLQVREGDVRAELSTNLNNARKQFDDLIGSSPSLTGAIKMAQKYAPTESAILLNGETGTGKEIFAQSIHNYSTRRNQSFVAVNCAALSESVLESELFGYVKGAFTGAINEGKSGLFEAAHLGTIFLDEIGEISASFQAKLLRVLQEKEITRIGDTKSIPIDVRIISATNRNLVEMVEAGDFREDLYYRLNVLNLKIPPLRQRPTDIIELATAFINQSKRPLKISKNALSHLTAYEFPGNVRQLQNIIERLIVLADNETIDSTLIDSVLENEPRLKKTEVNEDAQTLTNIEKQTIQQALQRNKNNKTLTAEELKISKTTLWRKIKLYGLE